MSNKDHYKIRTKLTKDQILTIPNMLSFFRLALIPVIVILFLNGKREWTTFVILFSGFTDIVDGYIARKFNMTSDFGKAIDPLADKLTQIAVLACFASENLLIILPIAVMVIKEVGAFVLRLIIYKKTEAVTSAQWHGKVNTVLLHAIILLHVIWIDIPEAVSNICILTSTGMMILSCVLYSIDGASALVATKKTPKEKTE